MKTFLINKLIELEKMTRYNTLLIMLSFLVINIQGQKGNYTESPVNMKLCKFKIPPESIVQTKRSLRVVFEHRGDNWLHIILFKRSQNTMNFCTKHTGLASVL